mgnify:CR=1 FL=1
MIRILQGLRGSKRHGLAMVLGAVAALAMPPLNFWPLLFVSIPAFLMMLEALEKASYRAAFGLGWALGFGYFVVAFHWIGFAFLVDAETYLWMMPFAVGALALVCVLIGEKGKLFGVGAAHH